MADTMALKFRDFGREGSEATVPEHRKFIKQRGYVWWGWWARTTERRPREALHQFAESIREHGHLDVFLFNSDTEHLHKARMVEMALAQDDDPIYSPDSSATPDYYPSDRYPAWFRFTKIKDSNPMEIENWAVDEFIPDPNHPERKVPNVKWLAKNQVQTLWLLRSRQPGDKPIERSTEGEKAVPDWFRTIGVVFLGVGVLFVMGLIVAAIRGAIVPAEASYLVALLAGLIAAAIVTFLGGHASAEGHFGEGAKKHPIKWSLGGGVAALVVVYILVLSLIPTAAPGG